MARRVSEKPINVHTTFDKETFSKVQDAANSFGLTISAYVRMVVMQEIAKKG